MGRKKKLVNNTTIPQYAVERFARCVFDDIRADYARPEVQAEFALWLAEREQHKKTRAAKTAALVSVMGNKQIIRTRFRFGRYGSDYFALAKMGLNDTIAPPWKQFAPPTGRLGRFCTPLRPVRCTP